jgi:hypothetical protein
LKEAIVDAPPPDFLDFLFWFEEAMAGSSTPDFLDWAFWSKDSTSVRDLLVSLAAIIGLPLLIWREITGHRTVDIAAKRHAEQTEADRERRVTDNFTKAVELLGKPELEVRLGAIYALERIAYESERDHWPIMETLTAYVRTKAPVQDASQSNQRHSTIASAYAMVVAEGTIEAAQNKIKYRAKKVEVDIQAILIVLSRRNLTYEVKPYKEVNLWNLWKFVLEDWNQQISNFIRVLIGLQAKRRHTSRQQYLNLSNTNLSGADLGRANLFGVHLRGADLSGANLLGADLGRADLRGANLSDATLIEANLFGAHLSGADLRGANLFGTNLSEAYLRGANLSGADLPDAKFCKTIMPNGTLNNCDCPPETAPPNPSETPLAPN